MFNVSIKHMNKGLNCSKTYEVDEYHKFITFELTYMFNV